MPHRHAAPPSSDRLSRLIDAFRGRRVLVVGDVILDSYIWGDVERTSPEAPVPVVRIRRETGNLGGAANVVANLVALGAKASLVGVIGDDPAGHQLRRLLGELNVSPRGLLVDRRRPTIVKTRVVCQNQQLLRLDREHSGGMEPALRERLLAKIKVALKNCDLVILSDYDKGVLGKDSCAAVIALARERHCPVVVDPKGIDYGKYRGADFITPNQKEAQLASGVPIGDDGSLEAAARRLQRHVRGRAVLITRGAAGVAVFEQGRRPEFIPAQALSVYDVTGAGDSLIATFGLALAAGATPVEAARLGNAAGSIVVGKLGAAAVDPAELRAGLQHGAIGHKRRGAPQLVAEIEPLRAAGKRIVFTNGCFDLLHPGHLKFLQQARRLGDVLIVAINSDRSVREIKGAPRPVLGEEERVGLLSSLAAVDYVVVFDEPTPERLLALLNPDVLVKGKSIALKDVVGHRLVESHGGRVVVLPLLGELTTDSVVERIAGKG